MLIRAKNDTTNNLYNCFYEQTLKLIIDMSDPALSALNDVGNAVASVVAAMMGSSFLL